MIEKTFAIIKPDAVQDRKAGKIIDAIETAGFMIKGMKRLHMTKQIAEQFYYVHRERPFYNDLVGFMCSGPCIVMCLEKENAVKAWRNLMGATNPADAEPGTIRKQFGKSIDNNAVHGSDAAETAAEEIAFFFSGIELL